MKFASSFLNSIKSVAFVLPFSLLFAAPAFATSENFEAGIKDSYTTGNVTLSSGSWNFNEALVGNLTTDRKNGAKSARIRNSGRISMNFNRPSGAGTISIRHAVFGTDGSSTWQLFCSNTNGSTWQQIGSTINTTSTTLQTAVFSANMSGSVRCEVRKTDGTTSRLNIDDISIGDFSSAPAPAPSPTPTGSIHLALGNPSNATTSTANPNNYLMVKPEYALAYNNARRIPRWVSWALNSSWIGSAPRQNDFRADTTLPSNWYRVGGSDYSGSGYDRGHMTPSADRTSSVTANSATFLMTNMIPQAPDNNQGPWAQLEDYTRSLVTSGNEIYIIAGEYGDCGTGSNGRRCEIITSSGNRIAVPARTWKVIVVVNSRGAGASGVNTSTRVIAVDMPNDQGIRNVPWRNYRVTVRDIENRTGLNLLSNVPASIQEVIETRRDTL